MDARKSVGLASGRSKWRALSSCTNRRVAVVDVDRVHGPLTIRVAGRTFGCCQGCAVRQGWAVRELISRGLQDLPVGSWVAFLTVTEGVDPRGLSEHGKAVSRFLGDLFRVLGGKRAYIGVRELQKRDAWHTHLLIADWRKVDWDVIRRLLTKHGLGHVFYLKAFQVRPEGTEGLSRYLSKSFGTYFTKSARDGETHARVVRHLPRGGQLCVASRSWAGGQTRGGIERERLQAYRARMLADVVPWRYVTSESLGSVVLQELARQGVVAIDDPVPEQGWLWDE